MLFISNFRSVIFFLKTVYIGNFLIFQAALKKKRRKLLKEKAKIQMRKQLKMVHEDSAYDLPQEQDLFSLNKIAKAKKIGIKDDKREKANISLNSKVSVHAAGEKDDDSDDGFDKNSDIILEG